MVEQLTQVRIVVGIANGTGVKAPTKTMTLAGGVTDVEYLFELIENSVEERNSEIKAEYVHETFPDAKDDAIDEAFSEADKNAPTMKRL